MKSKHPANIGFGLAVLAGLLCFGIFIRNMIKGNQSEPQFLIAGFFILFMGYSLWQMGKQRKQ